MIDDLIRRVDDVELPTPGRWRIGAHHPVALRTSGWRRRTLDTIASGDVTIADDPQDSTLDLHVVAPGDPGAEDLVIHAGLVAASAAGAWRFDGTARATVTVPIAVDVRYHGVYRRGDRAAAWLAVRADVPALGDRRSMTLLGDLTAVHPGTAA